MEVHIPERVTVAAIGLHFPVCYNLSNCALTNLAIKLLNQYTLQRRIVSLSILGVHRCQRRKADRHLIQGPVPSSLKPWQRLANPSSQIR